MAIVSRLEKEPWQPDLLMERQSDKSKSSPDQSTKQPPSFIPTLEELAAAPTGEEATSGGGFQGVIPVIVKSPASVITMADSDCVDSIFEDLAPKKISGIQEYLQQTHDEQEQQRQHQEELQLQYQLPAQLLQKKQQQQTQKQRQQPYQRQLHHRNSFHGEPTPFLHLEETEQQQNQQEHHEYDYERHMAATSFASPRPSSTYEPRMAMMLEGESALSKTESDNEVTRSMQPHPVHKSVFFCFLKQRGMQPCPSCAWSCT